MATKKVTTLHPYNNLSENIYPNVVDENIPDTILRKSDLLTSLQGQDVTLGSLILTSLTAGTADIGSGAVKYDGTSLDISKPANFEDDVVMGKNAEVDGTVTLNSPTDIRFKTGSLDFTELTDFISVYNREAYQYKFAGASLAYGEEGLNTFNPSYSLPNFHKATSLLGLFSRADITGITDIEFPDMDATLPDYIQMRALADYATANNDFNITLGSGSYNFQYMFWSADKETTFKQHLKKFMVADGKTAYVQNAGGAFQYCTGLTEIGAFDLSACIDLAVAFIACTSLKSIHCTHFKVKFDISASTQFEESDLVEIIGNLDTVTTAQTLTMGATNLAKLTQEEILVATGKGWTLA